MRETSRKTLLAVVVGLAACAVVIATSVREGRAAEDHISPSEAVAAARRALPEADSLAVMGLDSGLYHLRGAGKRMIGVYASNGHLAYVSLPQESRAATGTHVDAEAAREIAQRYLDENSIVLPVAASIEIKHIDVGGGLESYDVTWQQESTDGVLGSGFVKVTVECRSAQVSDVVRSDESAIAERPSQGVEETAAAAALLKSQVGDRLERIERTDLISVPVAGGVRAKWRIHARMRDNPLGGKSSYYGRVYFIDAETGSVSTSPQ